MLHAQLDQAPFGRVQIGVQCVSVRGCGGSLDNTSFAAINRCDARRRLQSSRMSAQGYRLTAVHRHPQG